MINLAKLGIFLFGGGAVVTGVAVVSGVLDPAVVEKASLANTAIERPAGKIQSTRPSIGLGKSVQPEAAIRKKQFPIFHLLTVENGDSALIAGNAAPGAFVEIIEGDTVLATTTAADNGDFAAILEQPLPRGEHHLYIRETGKDNTILMSQESGVLSVPENMKSDALVMVMKPGKQAGCCVIRLPMNRPNRGRWLRLLPIKATPRIFSRPHRLPGRGKINPSRWRSPVLRLR